MTLVQTVYILQKDQWEQSRKTEQELTTTSKKAQIRKRHSTSPAPLLTKKAINAIVDVIGYVVAKDVANETNENIILETGTGKKTRLKMKVKPQKRSCLND